METVAEVYVLYIAPAAKAVIFFVVLMFVIWLVNYMRDLNNILDLAQRTMLLLWNSFVKSFVLLWKGLTLLGLGLKKGVETFLDLLERFVSDR